MSDFLRMLPTETAAHVSAIDDLGQTLATGWAGAKSAIDGAVSGIGADVVGQAFAAGFLAASDAVRSACDQVPPEFDRLVAVGNQSVGTYAATIDQATGLLGGVADGRA